jgi:N-acetylneuraminic acid mutarotase
MVQAYDIATDSWSVVAPLPEPLHHVAVTGLEGKLYAVGGFAGPFAQREPVDSLSAYDPALDRWQRRAPLPTPRGAAAAVVIDGLVYALGGERRGPSGGVGDYESVTDVAVYDPRTDRWEILPPMRYPRNHLHAGAVEGRIYAVGGRDSSDPLMSVVEEYDPTTRTWRERAPMPTGRSGGAAALLSGKLYVFGGEGNPDHPLGVFPQVEAYDPATDSWAQLDLMFVPRHGLSAVAVGDRIYLPAGSPVQGGREPGQGAGIIDAFAPD